MMRVLEHKQHCFGNMSCMKCGRKICVGCEQGRLCPICAGSFQEHEINLHPCPNRTWDKEENEHASQDR